MDSSDSSPISSSSSSESDSKRAKKKKKKRSKVSMWDFIEDTWPVALRPPRLRKKSYVNKLSMKEVESLYNMHCSREKSLRGQKLFQAVAVETSHPTVKFQKGKDDCKSRLHKARFQRLPLTSPETWFKKVPLKRNPVVRQLPLEYSGSHDKVSEKVIEVLHDRSKALTLKEFYSKNFDAASKSLKDGDSSDWVNFEGLQGIQESFCNFGSVYQWLWPNDPTPTSFWRTLIDYNWGSSLRNPKLQEKIICDYFEKVTKKNANRAVRKEAPYDQSKHEEVFRQICRDHRINPDDLLFGVVQAPVAGPKKAQPGSSNKPQKGQGGGAGKAGGGAKAASSKPADKRGWPTYEGLGVCFGYNSVEEAKKCKNTAHEGGCKGKDKQGHEKIYAHVCSNWLEGKGYCLGAHMKKDCKGDK